MTPPPPMTSPQGIKVDFELPMLPCWDETDDGLLPFCRGEPPVAPWKVFNPLNK